MFIAMNRFKVVPGSQTEFERVWTTRDTHLRGVSGFITFHLLRDPDATTTPFIRRTRSGAV
jgi:heme-degrading monooxygenase HmoA